MSRALLLMLWSYLIALPMAWGQDGVRRFVRITAMEAIQTGEQYLIGGLQSQGDSPFFGLLSHTLNSKGKIVPLAIGKESPSTLSLSEAQCSQSVWTFSVEKEMVQLQCAKGNLEVTKATTTTLTFRTKGQEGWHLEMEKGHFVFQQQGRLLTLVANKEIDGRYSYAYGAYKENYGAAELQIYREVKSFGTQAGEATQPQMNVPLGLGTASSVVNVAGKLCSQQPLRLRNDLLAQEDSLLVLTASPVVGDTFALTAPSGKSLPQHLKEVRNWVVTNGYICTTEGTPRYLVAHQGELSLLGAEDAAMAFASPLRFVTFAPKADVRNTARTLTLTGGWTEHRLRQVKVEGIRSIDLRQAVLPATLPDTFATPLAPNSSVFLSQHYATYPTAWPLVIVNDTLQGIATLVDNYPYAFAQPFFAPAGKLNYHREAFGDGGWETICLPFTASLPSTFVAERLKERQGTTLIFTPADSLLAGEAAILRYSGTPTLAKVSLTLANRSGWIRMPEKNGELVGTSDSLRFATDGMAYLLESKGNYFLPAQGGSSLKPFRAYLPMGTASHIALLHAITGLHATTTELGNQSRSERHDLLGRPVSATFRGLIIENGQKRWR